MKRFFSSICAAAIVVAFCGFAQAQEAKYEASKNSDKYHTMTCIISKYITPENKVTYNTKEEAGKSGKKPCELCMPAVKK